MKDAGGLTLLFWQKAWGGEDRVRNESSVQSNPFGSITQVSTIYKLRDFGGVRIEDDVLVLDDGYRVLGRPIPRTMDEVEAAAAR